MRQRTDQGTKHGRTQPAEALGPVTFRASPRARCRFAYTEGRKAPFTQKAGPGYLDPDYDLSSDWIATRQRIDDAQLRWADPLTRSRVLLICGSARNDGTCPGEISKTFRLLGIARETLEQADIQTDVLDLSQLTSDYGRKIHPCKGCVPAGSGQCSRILRGRGPSKRLSIRLQANPR